MSPSVHIHIYISTRNKKSLNTPGRLEKKKYNPNLKRHTLHRETK
jgi:large subunit ribosomal protein L33